MTPLLRIKNLSKIYPDGVRALNQVSLEVQAGEFVAVIGSSGSGKSTLLRCLNRLVEASDGQIFFDQQEITTLSDIEVRKLRQQIAMVFQQFNLISRYSALTNVLMGSLASTSLLQSLLGRFSKADKARAAQVLESVGLAQKAWTRVDHLSGGQQQRVSIARSLMQKPKILLADEPVASLDPISADLVMSQLKKMNQETGLTVLINLHSISLVQKYATRVIALKAGQLVFDGKPTELEKFGLDQIYSSKQLESEI